MSRARAIRAYTDSDRAHARMLYLRGYSDLYIATAVQCPACILREWAVIFDWGERPARVRPGPTPKYTDAQRAQARDMWEAGRAPTDIAQAIGCSVRSLSDWAVRDRWSCAREATVPFRAGILSGISAGAALDWAGTPGITHRTPAPYRRYHRLQEAA